jgi:hypothetical protein
MPVKDPAKKKAIRQRYDRSATARDSRNRRAAAVRAEMVTVYGGRCACPGCDETDPMFLTLDHVDGRPPEHANRRLGSMTGHKLYMWARRNGWPKTLQLLCFNCNCGRARNGGVCPHLAR